MGRWKRIKEERIKEQRIKEGRWRVREASREGVGRLT